MLIAITDGDRCGDSPSAAPIPCSGHPLPDGPLGSTGPATCLHDTYRFGGMVGGCSGPKRIGVTSRSFDAAHTPQRPLPAVTQISPALGIGEVYRRSHLLGNGSRDLPRTRPARRLPGAQLTVRARPTNYKPRRLQKICLARPSLDALDARCFSEN